MALPPLPPNNTGVYFIDYSFQGEQRTMQFRTEDGLDATSLEPFVGFFLATLSDLMDTTWQIDLARFRAEGGIVSLPAPLPDDPSPGVLVCPPTSYPRYVNFVGRGLATGRRVTLSVYGLVFPTPEDYRLQGSEVPAVAAAIGVLNSYGGNRPVSIGGDPVIWYSYANVGFNSYHQREQRT